MDCLARSARFHIAGNIVVYIDIYFNVKTTLFTISQTNVCINAAVKTLKTIRDVYLNNSIRCTAKAVICFASYKRTSTILRRKHARLYTYLWQRGFVPAGVDVGLDLAYSWAGDEDGVSLVPWPCIGPTTTMSAIMPTKPQSQSRSTITSILRQWRWSILRLWLWHVVECTGQKVKSYVIYFCPIKGRPLEMRSVLSSYRSNFRSSTTYPVEGASPHLSVDSYGQMDLGSSELSVCGHFFKKTVSPVVSPHAVVMVDDDWNN